MAAGAAGMMISSLVASSDATVSWKPSHMIPKVPSITRHVSHGTKWHQLQIKCSENHDGAGDGAAQSKRGGLVKRRGALMASFAVGACSCFSKALLAAEDWSYGGPSGPPTWPGTCATGAQQSPIDVRVKKNAKFEESTLGKLAFDYKPSTPTFTNPGHGTMEVEFPDGVNKLRVKGRELDLVQFHFHTPSEHAFDGVRFPMEAHLVHRDPVSKAFAVVGIMLDSTPKAKPNEALAAALQYSPLKKEKRTPNVPQDFRITSASLLPTASKNDIRRYMQYSGSLTTPPCHESVDWILLETPVTVSTV